MSAIVCVCVCEDAHFVGILNVRVCVCEGTFVFVCGRLGVLVVLMCKCAPFKSGVPSSSC